MLGVVVYEHGFRAADGLAMELVVECHLKPSPGVLGIASILQAVLVALHKELQTVS